MEEIEGIPPIPEGLSEEDRKMMLDPLGYDAIQDIDEIHLRNRRKSDDPYLKATKELKKMKLMENKDYKRWKNNDAERR